MSKRAKTAVYLLKIITSLLLYRAATMARQLLMIVAELFQKTSVLYEKNSTIIIVARTFLCNRLLTTGTLESQTERGYA
jgi:hypothetical protein